jgi:hypothetical protein
MFFCVFLLQINTIEEPLVNMEVVSSETDPLLFRYSKAVATNQSQDVFPVTWCEVQVRTAVEVTAYVQTESCDLEDILISCCSSRIQCS